MFAPLKLSAKSSKKRKLVNTALVMTCAFFVFLSPIALLHKIIFCIILSIIYIWLLFKEKQVIEIDWIELEDIQITSKISKSSYKLSSCITTSWYCSWVLTSEKGGYKKLHLWFDQFDEQTTWQLRRNLVALKENTP